MTEEQNNWFDKLYKNRSETANTLKNDFAIGNMWDSVVEKYSDQAHFIYELLQNANDVHATTASFYLNESGLYFKHNGTKYFWVSNPDNERQDQKNNQLGDLNAITAVAQSNKKDQLTIGKFGVGFKAVFQYTTTPHIYEPNFKFKITNYIVPERLEGDLPERQNDETVFYFPFDKNEMSRENAYFDILEKLKKLAYPTLFLTNLKTISWKTATNEQGNYSKLIEEKKIWKNITCQKIALNQKEKLWLFSRNIENKDLVYSTGFFIDDKGKLTPKKIDAFCFFPTKETTNLNFIIHAPFLLTDSRESIHRSKEHNVTMVELLAKLSADSLSILRDLKLIDDNIVNIIPYKKPEEEDLFGPFYKTIKEKFKTEEILPARDRNYVKHGSAYWAQDNPVLNLFSDEQLAYLTEDENAKWVFRKFVRNQTWKNEELRDYIEYCTIIWYDMDDMLGLISDEFIESQSDEWLHKFYEYLTKNNSYWDKVKTKPIFLNQLRKAIPAFNSNNKLLIFLPDNDGEGYGTLNKTLFNKTSTILAEAERNKTKQKLYEDNTVLAKQFYEKLGIREHTIADEIEETIEKFKREQLSAESFFFKTFKYYKDECPQDKIDAFIEKIEDLLFIPYYSKDGSNGTSRGKNLFYPIEKLVAFYEQQTDVKFVDINTLQSKYHEKEYKSLDNFLKKLGVKSKDPELKDCVYDIIIPKFQKEGAIDPIPDFKTLFQYYRECKNEELEEFIEDIKGLNFIIYKSNEDNTKYRGCAEDLYYPTLELQKYFKPKPSTKFIELDDYHRFFTDEKEQKKLKDFFLKLGVRELPRILKVELSREEKMRLNLDSGSGSRPSKTEQKIIDGCVELLTEIDKEKSLILWKILGKLQHKVPYSHRFFLNNELKGVHNYFYRTWYVQPFESKTITALKSKKWLINQDNIFVAPNEITINDLADGYEKNQELESLLGFKPATILTREQRIAAKFENEEEAEEARIALLEKRNANQNTQNTRLSREHSLDDYFKTNEYDTNKQTHTSKLDRTIKDLGSLQNEYTLQQENSINKTEETEHSKSVKNFKKEIKSLEDLEGIVQVKSHTRSKPNSSSSLQPYDFEYNENEELAKGIEKLKSSLETKKQRVDLVENINNSIKYSYNWFRAYLELLTTYGEKQDTLQQKSISFQEIKPFKTDNKYFLLCGASSYISPEIEDAEDFRVTLVFGNSKKENITVEGVSKKGQNLLIYCRESISTDILSRLSNVFKAEIKFTPVIDLLNRLFKAFSNINYIDEWQDIHEEIRALNYIYGPPGTGKTTKVCKKIQEILSEKSGAKILVLTPTNKAADVVCKKLWDIDSDIFAIRLSHPTDPELEEEAIYRDTLNDEDMEDISIVASTIHRLPYFKIQNESLLFQYPWDYVIFDESSMIGLHYITFAIMALSKSYSNTQFIIAGDPKQIPPVVEIDDNEIENFEFQDENIYKMMNLDSFNPEEQTIREIDSIENLATQYRSAKQIGQLFSELSYSKLLKHDREINGKETKPLPEKFKSLISSNVTYIDFPLNQENTIYKVNKLFYSSYHTYCTILVSEIIKYFDSVNESQNWTIGLISPYKAQAILLNKLISSYGISKNIKVHSDTVHGFQGDECDIVFFICNPNNYFYSGHEKALLSKEYIYNVAISRAKDYLVILHPYSKIPNNPFINKIGLSYMNNFGNSKILNAKDIEKVLFNHENFIENNSYVSGHDIINVFGFSEMKYFIKANDTAIDIQLRDSKDKN